MRELIFDFLRSLLREREQRRADTRTANTQTAEALDRQLGRAVEQYTSVNAILWTVFSIFAAGHAVLVDALVQGPSQHGYISAGTGLVLSAVGFLAALAWALLIRRTIGHLVWHLKLVEMIEGDMIRTGHLDKKHRIFPARDPRQPECDTGLPMTWRLFDTSEPFTVGAEGCGPPAKQVMQRCAWWAASGWFVAGLWFALRQCVLGG